MKATCVNQRSLIHTSLEAIAPLKEGKMGIVLSFELKKVRVINSSLLLTQHLKFRIHNYF